MKKLTKILILCFALVALFSVFAFAGEEPTTDGIYGVMPAAGFTVEFFKADSDTAIVGTEETIGGTATTFFSEAERLKVTFTPTADKYYMIFVLESDVDPAAAVYPTKDNIVYIDQETAAAGDLTLTAFPSKLENGKTYVIYISSNDGTITYTEAGRFKYYQSYTLGDVNGDKLWNSSDALMVLNFAAGNVTPTVRQKLAADVTFDNILNSSDALKILNYAAGNITSFK